MHPSSPPCRPLALALALWTGACGTSGDESAGPPGAGSDAGTDTGSDTTSDTISDDAPLDSLTDAAWPDAPPDASPDAPIEANPADATEDVAESGPAGKPRLWVFLLAGQSNMVGLGYNGQLTGADANPVDGVWIYYNGSIHPNANALQWKQLAPGFGATEDRFGPELAFGQRMHELWPTRSIAVIKVAEGGTALHDRWAAGTGDLYLLLLSEIQAQLAALQQDWRPQIAGLVWMQGESDAIQESTANAYLNHLAAFMTSVRSSLGVAVLPTTAGLIYSNAGLWPYAATVRNSTAALAGALGQMDVVETNDLSVHADDLAHYDSASTVTLGRRFADATAGMLAEEWHFPEGFSGVQGDHFWTYRSRAGGAMTPMTWDTAQTRWQGSEPWVLIGPGWMHPGPTEQAELGWWAPYAGRVAVDCVVTDGDTGGGDGVVVEVALGQQTVWGPVTIPNGGSSQASFEVDVVQGAELMFRTSSGAAQDGFNDATVWDVDVRMVNVE